MRKHSICRDIHLFHEGSSDAMHNPRPQEGCPEMCRYPADSAHSNRFDSTVTRVDMSRHFFEKRLSMAIPLASMMRSALANAARSRLAACTVSLTLGAGALLASP